MDAPTPSMVFRYPFWFLFSITRPSNRSLACNNNNIFEVSYDVSEKMVILDWMMTFEKMILFKI